MNCAYHSRRLLPGVVLLYAAIIGLSGCTRSGPKVAPVRGTVTYDGAPLSSGSVVFVPQSGGKYAQGEIQPDGTYRLTTFRENDGAIVGSHGVMVSAVHFPPGRIPAAAPLVPMRYSNDKTSGLTAVIVEQPENVVDLALTKKPAAKR